VDAPVDLTQGYDNYDRVLEVEREEFLE